MYLHFEIFSDIECEEQYCQEPETDRSAVWILCGAKVYRLWSGMVVLKRILKKWDVIIPVLEAVLVILLIMGYRNALPRRVNTWSRGIDIHVSENEKDVTNEKAGLSEKKIAITFDDGPHPVYTKKLLEGLKERGVRATFFVLGQKAKEYPEIVKQMEEDGHIIGNHTYTHIQLRSSNREKFRDELVLTNEVISGITGKEVQYVRPPYGTWDKKLEGELNMFPVLWNVDPNDWCTGNADKVTKRIVDKAKENSIILLHDCYQSSVDAALASIDILTEEGYEFVTVEEILFE